MFMDNDIEFGPNLSDIPHDFDGQPISTSQSAQMMTINYADGGEDARARFNVYDREAPVVADLHEPQSALDMLQHGNWVFIIFNFVGK